MHPGVLSSIQHIRSRVPPLLLHVCPELTAARYAVDRLNPMFLFQRALHLAECGLLAAPQLRHSPASPASSGSSPRKSAALQDRCNSGCNRMYSGCNRACVPGVRLGGSFPRADRGFNARLPRPVGRLRQEARLRRVQGEDTLRCPPRPSHGQIAAPGGWSRSFQLSAAAALNLISGRAASSEATLSESQSTSMGWVEKSITSI